MLVVAMKRLCRVGLAAALVTAFFVLTLVDMPQQIADLPADLSPTPAAASEPPGTRSIVAYSWARRLALDYRPSRECSRASSNETLSSSWSSDAERTWLESIPGQLFLYTGHLDIRVLGYPSVRVIGVKREPTGSSILYCTICYSKNKRTRDLHYRTTTLPAGTTAQRNYFPREKDEEGIHSYSMEALVSDIWLDEWGGTSTDYTGILITCPLPQYVTPPRRVYVGPHECYQNPSHSLIVKNVVNKTVIPKTEFTLCIKGLDFDEDISHRLIAFFELSRILGAGMFYVYVFNVHENVTKVLKLYEKSNVVRWFRLNLPGDLPNDVKARRRLFSKDIWMKRRMELIPYNHCFYENLYSSEFVVPIDIDEMIIPINVRTWSELMALEKSKGNSFYDYASYAVRNVYFFPELQRLASINNNDKNNNNDDNDNGSRINKNNGKKISTVDNDSRLLNYFHTLRTSIVSPEGDSVKSFVSTERALTIHNHYALTTLNPTSRRVYHLDPRQVLKHHHRRCDNDRLDCGLLMRDLTIDQSARKYLPEFKSRVKFTLSYLNASM
ncbi:GSCOCG00003122001-RA-CDS [Cotesia congregata]|nr:GSCOCG00003122001-RA-CDS [Cotesia congregata]